MTAEANAPLAIQFPHSFDEAYESGGIEVVEERRPGQKTRRSLFVLDEEQRVERQHRDTTELPIKELDAEYVKKLHNAREVLLKDNFLQPRFLFGAESCIWPHANVISDAVKWRVEELENEGNREGAARLRQAAAIHEAEWTLPGRYPFEESIFHECVRAVRADLENDVCLSVLHAEDVTPHLERCLYTVRVDPTKRRSSFNEILTSRILSTAEQRIDAQLASLGGAETLTASTWSQIQRQHQARRQASATASSSTVTASQFAFAHRKDAVTTEDHLQFLLPQPALSALFPAITPQILANEICERRVKMLSGIYLSFFSLEVFAVIIRTQCQPRGAMSTTGDSLGILPSAFLSREEYRTIEVHPTLGSYLKRGRVVLLRTSEPDEQSSVAPGQLKKFVSSLSRAQSDVSLIRVGSSVSIHSTLKCVEVTIPGNIFGIPFGPKVIETFEASASAARDVAELAERVKRRGNEEASRQMTAAKAAAREAKQTSARGAVNYASLKSVEQIAEDVKKAVEDMLILDDVPFGKILQQLRDEMDGEVAGLETHARAALKKIAVYDNTTMKYRLKD